VLALALSGCVTATEQQQFDAVLYEQIHAEAIASATVTGPEGPDWGQSTCRAADVRRLG